MTLPVIQKQVNSCATCPSFLKPKEAVKRYGRSTGSSMCGRFGTVLSRDKLNETEGKLLLEHVASQCNRHGDPLPDIENSQFVPVVATPGNDLRETIARFEANQGWHAVKSDNVKSCNTCAFFIPPDRVAPHVGFPTGMCAKRGILLLPNKQAAIAQRCDKKIAAANDTDGYLSTVDASEMEMMEFYEPEFYADRLPVASASSGFDPRTYETDKELSAQDIKAGIRAWCQINDPNDEERFTYHPIFDLSSFDASEAAKIPQAGDDEHPELHNDHNGAGWRVLVSWMELDETPIAWGPAGVGKTELARFLAWRMQLPFERFSITAATELDDLAGKMLYSQDKGTYFEKGRLPLAWAKRSVLLIDEPNTAPPEVWQFLRPLTDNSKQLVLDMAHHERIERHQYAFMMLAANPAWDSRNVGAQTIGDADGSRLMHIKMGLPPRDVERIIIERRVKLDGWKLNTGQSKMILDISTDIRDLIANNTLADITWGIRMQIKVARALKWFSPVDAYRLATDNLDDETQETVLTVVRSHVPPDKPKPHDNTIAAKNRKGKVNQFGMPSTTPTQRNIIANINIPSNIARNVNFKT